MGAPLAGQASPEMPRPFQIRPGQVCKCRRIESLRYDFEIVLIIQGSDEQNALYREVESLIHQLEVASGLERLEKRLW